MRLTFPHMGNMYIPLKAMLQYLGADVVLPPPTTKKTLTLGVKHASEFACMPLKLNLGNFIEAHERGADTVVMAGGCGPCRFGYYAQIEHAILREIGCDMELIVLEPPEKHISEFIAKVRKIAGTRSWWQVIQAIRFGYQKARAVDLVEIASFKARPRELVPGATDRAYDRALALIDGAASPDELKYIVEEALQIMAGVAQEHSRPVLRIALIGEIYTLLDPFSNHSLERRLGLLGVEVDRSIYLSEWVNDHLFMGLIKGMRSKKEACAAAAPYLRHFVGGHGQETVGSAVNYARAGYDGLIQVFPFTCMPEIVAKSILPGVSDDLDIPVLMLIMDEQSGEAGLMTRLEAFVDLLARRKETGEVVNR
ncbi:MAG: acyl-CoA dehydratase activase-related protein [Desulfotomaculaceae bacterium]|nr:acyl-CoA dehydratase activase-related protein [Desulfotomaculaceae bacterium]